MPLPASRGYAVPSYLLCALALVAGMGCVNGVVDEYGTRVLAPVPDGGRVLTPPSPGAVPNPYPPPPGTATDARPADTRRNGADPPKRDAAPPPSSGGGCTDGNLPAPLLSMFVNRCQTCHGNPPLPTVPGSLTSYEELARPSKTDPGRTMAEMALFRIRNTAAPMPPAPGTPVPDAEARFLETWIETGMPLEGCSTTDGGAPGPRPDAGPPPSAPPVFNTPSVCTSRRTYQGGNNQRMRPGDNCLNCHGFDAAGTVYPTAHEPRFCNGVDGDGDADGAQVVVTDSQGRTSTAQVNNVGNFIFRGNLRPPLRVKITFQGRERLMISMAPAGSCNRCHSEDGTTTVNGGPKAPGRIVLP